MSFAFDVTSNIPRITQSGTDTNLDGITTAINAVPAVARSTPYTTSQMVKPPTPTGFWYRCSTAGTTAASAPTYGTTLAGTTSDGGATFTAFKAPDIQSLGSKSHYYMPDVRMNIAGALTNANNQISDFTCLDIFLSSASSYFKSGAFATDGVTPLYDGLHFVTTFLSANNTQPSVNIQFGTMELIGGEAQTSAAVSIASGSKILSYTTRWRGTRVWGGVSSTRFRAFSSTSVFRSCEFYDMAYDLFVMPAEFSVVARDSEYVAQYVGGTYGGVDALFKAYALNNPNGSYDFDNFSGGYVELYNCAKGASLNVVTQLPSTRMCTPLFQEIRITAKDTAGAPVQNVRFKSTDAPVDSPQQTFVTAGNLKTWDFRNKLSYETTSNASGIALSTPCLHVWYYTNALKKNLRYPSSTASYQGRAYAYKTGSVSLVLGSDAMQDVSAGMVGLDTATTVSEATALANANINVTTQNGGITIAVKGNSTYQDIWNSYRAYISQFANWSVTDNWTCLGGNLTSVGASILVYPGVTLSSSANISYTYADTFKALSLADTPYLFNAGGVLQATGVLLPTTVLGVQDTYTGVGQILALYASAAGASTTFQFQGITVGSSIVIYDASDVTKYFQQEVSTAGTYSYYIPPGTAGTYYWAIEKYGTKREEGSFAANTGGLLFYVPLYAEDVGITQATKATTAGYTTLETNSKLYDYVAYSRLSEQFIKLGQILTRSGTSLEWKAGYSAKVKATNASVFSLTSTTFFIKASSLAGDTKYTTNILVSPATLTADTTEVLTTEIEDGNGDSSLTISAASVSTFEIWKITDATNPDNYATGTLLATVGIGKFRFLSANGFKFVVRDTVTNYRVVVEAEKGTYKAELFFGAAVQLAQAAEVSQINTKVDIMQIDVEAIKGTGFVKDTHSLTNIKKKAALAAALSA